MIKEDYVSNPAPAMMVGVGGKKSFIFQTKKAGTSTLKLKEWRSWLGDASVVERYNIVLEIN